MYRSLAVLFTLILALVLVPTAIAQEPAYESTTGPLVTVETERSVREIVGEKSVPFATVAPDGSAIAYGKQTGRGRNKVAQLCLYTFADANQVCFEAPEAYIGPPYELAWSPDSAYIAFTENPLQLGYESDIWLFNVAEGAFINLTDDGAQGSWRTLDAGSFALDYLPMWDQASGDLYFWRSVPTAELAITMELYRVSPEESEADLVRDLTDYFNKNLIQFDYESYYMDGPSALSPDGTQVALLSTSYQDVYAPESGLWLVDLTNETAPPQQVVDVDGFQAALPEWQVLPATPLGLSWTSDGAGVVVLANSPDTHTPFTLFYYVDVETGDATPVVDFSELESPEAYFTATANSLPPRYYSPWTATLTPAGDKLLMFNNLGDLRGMLAASLPPDGSLPSFIYESQTTDLLEVVRSSTSSDGKVLMYSLMFTISEKPPAGEAEAPAEPAAEEPAEEAAAGPSVIVESERPVHEIVGESQAPLATLAPDGSAIAYGKQTGRGANKVRQLCIYTFADANKACYDAPEAYQSYPYELAWSPDSMYIAFTENPLQLGLESDIWLLNVPDGTFTNLTDDGAQGAWQTLDVDYTLDYLPMWDQTSGDLYFWRSVPTGNLAITLELYRISPEGGEAELVRDLSEDFGQRLIRFDYEFYYMDGPSAVSPDGTKVVMVSTSFEDAYDLQNGLWLLDLTDDTVPPQQLADMDDFQSALPDWQQFPAVPVGLSWTDDSAGVVVLANSEDTHTPINAFYHVDVETGDITPVVDFSALEEIDAYFEPMGSVEGLPARYYSPWTGSLSPAGDKLLMYNDLGGIPGMMAAPLPPDGNLPSFVYEAQTSSSVLITRSSRGSDGKVLMYGFMFTVTEE